MTLADVVHRHFQWNAWERLIQAHGYTIDRPLHSAHPVWADIIYPMNYGYINGTLSTDGEGVDLFVGSATSGLVGLILTRDFRKDDREAKLLYHCTPAEVYTAHGFLNYDRARMEGTLVMRQPMHSLWAAMGIRQPVG